MAKIVLPILSIILGAFFMSIGVVKLTPAVNRDVHDLMQKNFQKAAKVFPFSAITGYVPEPNLFRIAIGCTEVISGIILIFVPGILPLIYLTNNFRRKFLIKEL